nr:hypothetical protein [Pseudomonas parafulva]
MSLGNKIESAETVSVSPYKSIGLVSMAGRDVTNYGTLQAGRDVPHGLHLRADQIQVVARRSGSAGYGRTNGSKNWVEKQTSITAQDGLDIRTLNHTQLDGALIASDTGKLKLDTDTLGFSDIAGKDKEHGYYLNVGGSYGIGMQNINKVVQGGGGQTFISNNGIADFKGLLPKALSMLSLMLQLTANS